MAYPTISLSFSLCSVLTTAVADSSPGSLLANHLNSTSFVISAVYAWLEGTIEQVV